MLKAPTFGRPTVGLSGIFSEGFPTCLPAGRRASLAGMTGSFVVQVIYGMTPFNLKKAVNHSQKQTLLNRSAEVRVV